MGENESSGGALKSAWGGFQGFAALVVGYGLNRVVAWVWPLLFHRAAPEGVKGVVPQVASAVLAVGVFFGAKALLAWRTRRKRWTAVAKGDRLAILIARLGEDAESESARECVIESIRGELGREVVEVIPAGVRYELSEGVSEDEAALGPSAKARALLREKHGDLLIWGRLHRVNGKTQIELRFVASDAKEAPGERKVFGYGEKLTLDADFGPEMGAALAAVVSAQAMPALTDSGTYLVEVLRPVADRLGSLAERLPASMKSFDRGQILFAYGLLQFAMGGQTGEESRLCAAVAAFRAAMEEWTRERVPLNWATTQNNLGNALQALGKRESGTERLEEAVEAYRQAMEEWTRERVPLNWATTQNNLGNALQALGKRESGTERLEEAVVAYREALKEYVRERVPLNWAMTQNNLGNALQALGKRESGTERLEEAVAVYREALKERTRQRVPLNWAMTQNNLGAALHTLGERESGTERLEEAVAAYREALKEYVRERVPLDWAMTQNNLGNALASLGERESGTERLEEAVVAYREALKAYVRERVPLDWAMTQNNLGNALRILGERESGTERLEEAVEACREALKERTRERVPLRWAMTQNNLGIALLSLGERESGTERLKEGVVALGGALEVFGEAAPYHEGVAWQNLERVRELLEKRGMGESDAPEEVS